MTLSLRGRLLIGVISLLILGLLLSDAVTYVLFQNSLTGRVDNELTTRSTVDTAVVVLRNQCHLDPRQGAVSAGGFPTNTVTELINPDGSVSISCRVGGFGGSASTASPVLPRSLHTSGTDQPVTPFTTAGTGEVHHYRVTDWAENSFPGQVVVFAIPVDDVQGTLDQLWRLELFISAAVVSATALLGWLIIQLGLRPLRRMGAVAGDIAAGDLSKRVEPATTNTEIGRLGLALNAMLSQIEAAFAQRTASENRLRRFIADASHELRTPLTSIRGYSEMLRRGAAESPADSDLARRRIEEESVRMSALVDDMLLIARLDQGRPLETKSVDLYAIASDAASDARAVAPQREITLDAPQSVMVRGDDTRLRQVVGNLVRNALVHTPARTPIEIGVTTHNGTAQLTVTDHGPGLRMEDKERIFEPFYRADPSRSRDSGGAGLGLSIVNAVVAAHGGRVDVKETSGGGATFEVELPLASSSS
jgi:two-component system OmpR family sensor kinase